MGSNKGLLLTTPLVWQQILALYLACSIIGQFHGLYPNMIRFYVCHTRLEFDYIYIWSISILYFAYLCLHILYSIPYCILNLHNYYILNLHIILYLDYNIIKYIYYIHAYIPIILIWYFIQNKECIHIVYGSYTIRSKI